MFLRDGVQEAAVGHVGVEPRHGLSKVPADRLGRQELEVRGLDLLGDLDVERPEPPAPLQPVHPKVISIIITVIITILSLVTC